MFNARQLVVFLLLYTLANNNLFLLINPWEKREQQRVSCCALFTCFCTPHQAFCNLDRLSWKQKRKWLLKTAKSNNEAEVVRRTAMRSPPAPWIPSLSQKATLLKTTIDLVVFASTEMCQKYVTIILHCLLPCRFRVQKVQITIPFPSKLQISKICSSWFTRLPWSYLYTSFPGESWHIVFSRWKSGTHANTYATL